MAHLHAVVPVYQHGHFVRGRNARSGTTIRYDEAAAGFEGELSDEKPRLILCNFFNEFAGVTDYVFPEAQFYNDDVENPGLPECGVAIGDQQVMDVEHLPHVERQADGTIPPWRHCK